MVLEQPDSKGGKRFCLPLGTLATDGECDSFGMQRAELNTH